jgi:cephalosporin-C deacetylase-like acetyl esterase
MRVLLPVLCVASLVAAEPQSTPRGNRLLADYFERQVAELESVPLPEPASSEAWEKTRQRWRGELADMLGLSPMPERTPLNPVKTGEVKGDGFIVEKLHFQSQPGLYVTANFYRPAEPKEPKLPTILYVCGHANVNAPDGTSLGNKAGYEHHGVWYARRGFGCLMIDTVQLGEIRGEHHGTYSKGRWWWMSRGYTPAGIEAWNGIRALDYLETRPDVDMQRIGINGRSGGGAYSWWVGALDDRVKVAVPTAGITTLRNHVVDGCVEGHCDCMFMVNTQRWDYDKVAALMAPRPLLIANTDKDTIFPLNGVVSIYTSVRKIYKALGAEGKIGIHIAEGPHKDTQALNTGEFAWFERFLKGADAGAVFEGAANKSIPPEQLRVFTGIPGDERNTKIDEDFVPAAKTPPVPSNTSEWTKLRDAWMRSLKTKSFAGWPQTTSSLDLQFVGTSEHDGVALLAWDFTPQAPWTLRLYVAHRAGLKPEELELITLNVLDQEGWSDFRQTMAKGFPQLFDARDRKDATGEGFDEEKKMYASQKWAMAYVAPRGVGPTAWTGTEKQQAQRLRRFYLIGQTLDGMQTWDVRRAIAALRETDYAKPPLWLQAEGVMAGNALNASLFEDGIARLDLHNLPGSLRSGPILLNAMKYLDTPQAVAIAASRSKVRVYSKEKETWSWPTRVAQSLGWNGALEVRQSAP